MKPTHPRFKDLEGQTFGRLTAKSVAGKNKQGFYLWECHCECGSTAIVQSSTLIGGKSRSCGCLARELTAERFTKHGHTRQRSESPEYRIWKGMIARCENPNRRDYPHYGGRGVNVCGRWRESFDAFLADMGPRPSRQHSIERIDNKGDYEPGNCCWETRKQQQRNKRNNHILEHWGQKKTLTEWSEITGIKAATLRHRVSSYGWSAERALTTPVRGGL